MTKKISLSRISRKRYRPRHLRKTRGGATLAGQMGGPSMLKTSLTLLGYGIASMLLGPLYLLAELINIPMNNLNNLSRKAFNENKQAFLHLPFFKMIKGCPIKTLKSEDFILQDDMHIHKNIAVVSCDKDDDHPQKVKNNAPNLGDSLLDIFSMIPDKRKLRHHVFGLFQYIDNIRETDEKRKEHIQKLLHHVPYKTLIQCYLIYKTMNCKDLTKEKTILMDEDVVNMINPVYYPWSTPYDTKVKCMWKHMTQKKFTPEEKELCSARCKTCTFRNSVGRMFNRYGSAFSCSQTSTVKSMFDTYYKYIKVDKKDPLPETSEQVVPYLNKLNPSLSADLKEKLDKSDQDEVIKLFQRFLCKYDIIPTVESQIKIKIEDKLAKGYNMKQLLEII